ncbi:MULTISPECIES: sce7725 family protein [Pseudomonas]|uniref:sce7725 family protein n=1 Tax=Pseudomonas TaxID=286 RepID=UPI000A1F7047|nr:MULTISPECIES: sce7725 family protein [Pseudomonas]UIN57068.1 sce7725 family protein [Pseudomonas kribbensis]
MYYPILRSKQFELIALRELSAVLSPELITPLIEPVRANLKPLTTTIGVLNEKGIVPIVIVNPSLGDFSKTKVLIQQELDGPENNEYMPCFKIISGSDPILDQISYMDTDYAVFIENGMDRQLIERTKNAKIIFANQDKVVPGAIALMKNVVLYRNSFNKQTRNADYGDRSFFSNLHTEYKKTGNVVGFGDFTILSEEYSESGGPAYVVTIHLSYIDTEEFDAMYVNHFSSYNDESPTNPGGKFKDALDKLVQSARSNMGIYYHSTGLQGFFELHEKPFPGLGQVKKLSLKHHIETICDYIKE